MIADERFPTAVVSSTGLVMVMVSSVLKPDDKYQSRSSRFVCSQIHATSLFNLIK